MYRHYESTEQIFLEIVNAFSDKQKNEVFTKIEQHIPATTILEELLSRYSSEMIDYENCQWRTKMERVTIGVVFINDAKYPTQLLKIKRPPTQLYFRGDINIINETKNIAIIGSRHTSDKGIKYAYQSGYEAAKKGLNVVNGLALGCDMYALKGALAAGGKCIAVLPCGLDQIVPRSNTDLAEELLDKGGCLISEYPIGTFVQKYQYIERDRLQSGISDGVLVIEAEENSGTMYTVNYSLKQGKCLASYSSRLLEYASGNQWIENQIGVTVIDKAEDLEYFIQNICHKDVFQQMRLEVIE